MTSEWSVPVPANPGLHNSSSLNCSWLEAISSLSVHVDAQRPVSSRTSRIQLRDYEDWRMLTLKDTEIAYRVLRRLLYRKCSNDV